MGAALGAAAALAFAAPARAQQVASDADAEQAVARFADELSAAGASTDRRIAAIRRVAEVRHAKVVRVLEPHLTGRCRSSRIVAARGLGEFAEVAGAVKALSDAYQNEANKGESALGVRITVVRSLGKLRARETAPLINRALADSSVWLVKAGVDAASQLRDKSCIEPLLKQLARVSGKDGNGLADVPRELHEAMDAVPGMDFGVPGVVRDSHGFGPDEPKPSTEREILRDPLVGALSSITGQRYRTVTDWQRWWAANKKTFEVPK
jgi:hypothetical protein